MQLNENDINELMARARADCCSGCRVRIEIGFLYCRVEHLTESDHPVGLLLQGYVGQYTDYTGKLPHDPSASLWTPYDPSAPGKVEFYDPTTWTDLL